MSDNLDQFILSLGPYKKWYRFGLRSPLILWSRNRASSWRFRFRMARQRALHEFSDDQFWSLDCTIATLIVEGTKRFRESGNGYPAFFSKEFGYKGDGWAEWENILSRIQEGFQAYLDEGGLFHDKPEQEAKFKDAMTLYGEWFGALWD